MNHWQNIGQIIWNCVKIMMADHIQYIGELKNIVAGKSGKILNLMVSGSDLFGFKSADSDTDYRGCWQINTNKLLTTRTPDSFIEYKVMKEGMTLADTDKHDVFDKETVLDELSKEIGLLLAGNCNHWEHLTAKQLMCEPEFLEMRKIFSKQMNLNGIYKSYRGMATQNYKKFILGGKHTVKKYLYVLRGLMACYHAMDTGKIEPNIGVLATEYDSSVTHELVDLKKRGMEKDPVNKNLDKYNKEVDVWFGLVDDIASELPIVEWKEMEERRNVLDEWLLEKRLGFLDGYKP